jgi:hypothetical protein
MADGDANNGFSGGQEMAIDARAMGHRMGVKEEDSASHDVRKHIFLLNSLNYNEQGGSQKRTIEGCVSWMKRETMVG